ncbi:MAG TPA: glycine cleavage system protein GcvH [Actinomycetota bacterium]|jgi:glycine cleavage system H protein|nr:glycine cleavage system protein GcvH [Actinomycetota bacterium]
MPDVPEDRRYTKEHEWAREEGGRVTVGVTDYAQDQLGDVVFVGLPEPGTDVTAGQPLGEIESTKSVSDVYSPVTGKVVEKNSEVEQNPELINEEPYGQGWLVRIEVEGESPGELLSAEQYRQLLEGEA